MPTELPLPATDFTLLFPDHYLRARTLRHPSPAADGRPWLVLLHDSLGSIRLWRDLPARLATALECHLLLYDRRGYGESAPLGPHPRTPAYLEEEAQTIPAVLAACGITRAVLFGHSDGGTLALLAAATAPALVAAAVTIGAHVFVEEETLRGIRAARQQYTTTELPQRLTRYHGANTEGLFRAWTDTWLSPAFRAWNIEPYLPRVQCPVLVLQGTHDEYGTEAQVAAIAGQVAGLAQAKLLEGLGHTPHRQDPALVVHLTATFLRPYLGLGPLPG
ncbi:pimeloyl-ACP methyl ester carboxylesterase [Hymenobacter luteus]|uniref:Pimeloyl-ACP methyl ester carboxylesterase n=2 Tax=Hymenobacter TaxID=89966 RepID=A0A7W9SXT6_9BACT|nr:MULTISPECIES: alpha/beta hydrolase [Hymenobacter]MBB4599789.1 pimeloyl-ACP methyl ester carboxylesterase [Hymenobacter latericoloratus]MBB6057901.1 pimeloyl-ACP methyl ester carboxylesterase [Hymenobacter luteus]